MTSWTAPPWPEPYDADFEIPHLQALGMAVSLVHPEIQCTPDFRVEGCAFVNFHREGRLIGRACVAAHDSGDPFFSAWFGADNDEFHGFNRNAILALAALYDTPLPAE